jgi:hypothetical protein
MGFYCTIRTTKKLLPLQTLSCSKHIKRKVITAQEDNKLKCYFKYYFQKLISLHMNLIYDDMV